MITYFFSANGLKPEQLTGFFADWPNPPTPETHLRLLRDSTEIIVALDQKTDQVVGFFRQSRTAF